MFSALLPAACADFEPARRSERAFDSPYANPQGSDVTCDGDSYLVGQRCVSASDLLDASAPRPDAAVDAGADAAQLGATDAAADAAQLDAAADAARDGATDARDGAADAQDGAPDARDDASDASLEAGIPTASDAQTDAAPEGGS